MDTRRPSSWRTASADPGKSCAPDVGTFRGPNPQSIFGADSLILAPAEVFASHAERGGPNQSGRIGGLVRLRTLPSPSPSANPVGVNGSALSSHRAPQRGCLVAVAAWAAIVEWRAEKRLNTLLGANRST